MEKTAELETGEQVLAQLKWRYATGRFDQNRRIPLEQWKVLEEALQLSPSSFGLQPWHFFVITDPELKKQLRKASFDQPQVEEASHLVVFAAKERMDTEHIDRHLDQIALVRGRTRESLERYRQFLIDSLLSPNRSSEIHEWTAKQTFIALGFLLSAAAMMKIDACPMESFDAQEYGQILDLPKKGYRAVVLAAVGYRAPDDPRAQPGKVRFELDQIITRLGGPFPSF